MPTCFCDVWISCGCLATGATGGKCQSDDSDEWKGDNLACVWRDQKRGGRTERAGRQRRKWKRRSAAIIKDLGGILSEKCANFFFLPGHSQTVAQRIPQLPVGVCAQPSCVCVRRTRRSVTQTDAWKNVGERLGGTAGQFDSCACFWYVLRFGISWCLHRPEGGNI